MITSLLDVTMDRMDQEIKEEFEKIDNGIRTALAFAKQADQGATLALLHRYAARHTRDYHRALDKLRQIQSERRDPGNAPEEPSTGHRPLATDYCILQNEPKPAPLSYNNPTTIRRLDDQSSDS